MRKILLSDYTIAAGYKCVEIPKGKVAINTINAYSWVMADQDLEFRKSLINSDYLLPDGIAIVWALRFLKKEKIQKIAGADLHDMVLKTLNKVHGKCFYLGASESTLQKIKKRLSIEYPNIVIETFSPPFKPVFSVEDNMEMIKRINDFAPDALFVGMTAPKQEKWIMQNIDEITSHIVCGIGAVFDFYAGTKNRPPMWMINCGLEWLGRLISDPKRLWKRYIIYNPVFIWKIFKLYLQGK